ncbi:MAG TPA: hypothetical protein VEK14_06185, partial [Rhodomicrobium sp.]|nr:hypothetical protein [Rhodomicrobium sp.]
TDFFRTAYVSGLREETESNIRTAASLNSPNDREGFYVKLIAIGLVSYLYDMAWAYIYRSQIELLLELNKGKLLPLAEAKKYYDNAAAAYPTLYANYPFDRWLEFLKSHTMILQYPGDIIDLTHRGKDFLKYLTHNGRYAEQKKY